MILIRTALQMDAVWMRALTIWMRSFFVKKIDVTRFIGRLL